MSAAALDAPGVVASDLAGEADAAEECRYVGGLHSISRVYHVCESYT
jgi:hypothetical protein